MIGTRTITSNLTVLRLTIAAATPFFVFAACFLVYCIHHDEHFQIMEFAHFKRGMSSGNKLAWEYDAKLRPTIQPVIACLLLQIMESIGLKDPFDQACGMRLLSTMLFLFASLSLCKTLVSEITSVFQKNLCICLTAFFYMFPLTGVRFSSENISSCTFVIGYSLLHPFLRFVTPPSVPVLVRSGVFFGLSFLFRYQSALLTLGLAVWLLGFRFSQIRYWLAMAGAFLLIVALGIIIDRWFYGTWTFTIWNYLNFNLIEGKSSTFGVSPWHFYFSSIDWHKWPRIANVCFTGGTLLFIVVRFRHPVSWIFTTFLLAHVAIPHKETRFLYPILIFVPFMVTSAYDWIVNRFPRLAPLQIALIPVTGINFIMFFVTSFSPLDNSTEIFKFIKTLPDKPIKIYYSGALFHYTLRDSRKDIAPAFYYDKRHTVVGVEKSIDNLAILRKPAEDSDTLTFVILDQWQQQELAGKFQPVFDPMPAFITKINYHNWMRHGFNTWKLYHLTPEG